MFPQLLVLLLVIASAPFQDDDVRDALERFRENRQGGFESVVAAGEPAVPGLIEILEDRSLPVVMRFKAANALGDIGSTKAVDALIRALKKNHFNVKRCAALALGKIKDDRALSALQELAEKDPFAWTDPETGETRYLVREDAHRALKLMKGEHPADPGRVRLEPEVFMDDAEKRPITPALIIPRSLDWPFPGDFKAQKIFNNYQHPAGDTRVHGALDFIQPAGTEVRAVESGYVAVIATNYPDWKTHHFFIVTPVEGGNTGWCYTHVDPDTYTFKKGDRIKKGRILGNVVPFSVGDRPGADHLHLHYVRFRIREEGKVTVDSMADPLLFFHWQDGIPPTVHTPFRFVREGTFDMFPPGEDGIPVVSGSVDIIAGLSDVAHEGQAGYWMVPLVTVEILGKKSKPWRKLVLDQRGEVGDPSAAPALYVPADAANSWREGQPRFPHIYFLIVTNTEGDGVIERADAGQTWDTASLNKANRPHYPDGIYSVTVRAWDLKGNRGEASVKVRVKNTAPSR